MFKQRLLVGLLPLLAVTGGFVSPAPSNAEHSSAQPTRVFFASAAASEASAHRIKTFKGKGNFPDNPSMRADMQSAVPPEQAQAAYVKQRNLLLFATVAEKLESGLPDSFITSSVIDTGAIRFDFSETPPAWVDKILSSQPFETQLFVRDAAPPLRQLEGMQYAAISSLQSDFPVGSAIDSTFASSRGVLSITFSLSSPMADEEMENAIREARARALAVSGGHDVAMEFMEGDATLMDLTANIKGGHNVRDGGSACTTAFTVRNTATSQQGVLSAAHCGTGSAPLYDGASGVLGQETEGVPCAGCGVRDVQWYPSVNLTIHPTTKRFRYDNNDAETSVSDTGSPQDGAYICQYGLVTNNALCGYVSTNDTYCKTSNESGRQFCGLKRATGGNLSSQDGDSGGPWFYGGVAMGVQSGKDSTYQYFTPIPQIYYSLPDLKIRTNANATS